VNLYTKANITGPAGNIEICLDSANEAASLAGEFIAVVCHPHPLYGGNMENNVVTTVAAVYGELGVPAARFNFRGVGASEGSHDNAIGEVDDLLAVADWLKKQLPDRRLLIAGYSFGSVIAARASYRLGLVGHLTLVAPPIGNYQFASGDRLPCPVIVALGELDDIVIHQQAMAWIAKLRSEVDSFTIERADHFFSGQLRPLEQKLRSCLLKALH
jgi:uncharacterized protein